MKTALQGRSLFVLAAVSCTVIAAVLILRAWFTQPPSIKPANQHTDVNQQPPSAIHKNGVSAQQTANGTESSNHESLRHAAAQIAKTAGKAWPELGVIPDHAQALEQDLERVLIAIFTADFSIYEAFMAERGSKLDEIARGFTDAMIEYGLYDPKQPELAEDLPDADRLRYIWNNPAPRRMAFAVVDPDSTRPGIGFNTMNNSPDWPHPGHYGQLSLYAPVTGRLQEAEGVTLYHSPRAAWVTFKATMQSGMQTRFCLHFVYNKTARAWIPFNIEMAPDGDHRPFPIL